MKNCCGNFHFSLLCSERKIMVFRCVIAATSFYYSYVSDPSQNNEYQKNTERERDHGDDIVLLVSLVH